MELVTYESLWEELNRKLPRWRPDREFFNVKDFLRFAVVSRMSPQLVEDVFVELLLDMASREPFSYKHILLPRETTKSSAVCCLMTYILGYPNQQVWGPRVRIAFDAEVKELSERNAATVMQALESNRVILSEVGCQKPSHGFLKAHKLSKAVAPWNIKKFKTLLCLEQELKDGFAHAEHSGTVVSSQKSTTGRHYDIRVVDDPVTSKTANSDVRKREARKTHMEMQSQLTIGTSLQIVLGTRHADDDIHNTIQTEFPENFSFQCRTVWDGGPELTKDDFQKDENNTWVPKIPYEDINLLWLGVGQLSADAEAGGFPKDPNIRKARALDFLRKRMDGLDAVTWARNMLNRSIAESDRVFSQSMFCDYTPEQFKHGECLHYILTDAASGRDFRSSYRVVVVAALDENDVAYIRHVDYGFWAPTEFSQRILDAYRMFPCRAVVLEEMSWRETVEANIRLQAKVAGRTDPKILVAKGINASSKRARVEALEPRFTNQRILFSPTLRVERDMNGKTKRDEIIAQFLKIQDIDSQPKLKVDIADAITLIDSLDGHGQRICRPPRSMRSTKDEANFSAKARYDSLMNKAANHTPSPFTRNRSLFGK